MPGAVNTVDNDATVWRQQGRKGPVELGRGQVGGSVVAGEKVHDDQVAGAGEAGGQTTEGLPGVAVAQSNTPRLVPGCVTADQVD
jgi:hypothetical protein